MNADLGRALELDTLHTSHAIEVILFNCSGLTWLLPDMIEKLLTGILSYKTYNMEMR